MRVLARDVRKSIIVLRLLPIIFSFLLFSLITHHSSLITPVYAEGEFSTDYDVTYTIDSKGLTTVSQNIILTNKTPNFYADKFELKIGSTKVINVTASDNTGPLETEVKFENNLTTIAVKFNQKVIGTGKSLSWSLNYTSEELAEKSGQIWEVSIPRLAKSADVGKYDAKVTVPRAFGPKAFAVPEPQKEEVGPQAQTYSFGKDQLLESGIAMSFGEKQVFKFKLDYFLQNNNVTSQIREITLPPDNNYQQIVLEKLDPKPLDVTVDGDGNFLAKYKLSPRQNLNITAEGYVEVFHKPFRNVYEKLTSEEKNTYVQPQRYWETDNALVKNKANELKTPEKIYDFVVDYLKYSQDRLNQPQIERKGAASAYATPTDSICMEFTDLFIAIARAAGIPAREVTGYAYTQNERLRPVSLELNEGDVLHAWPEYWDNEKGWIQIDPTWGSTSGGLDYFNKLDFNHVTFTQRGKSSTTPLPPGSFKKQGEENKKSVLVEFAQDLPQATVNAELELSVPANAIAAIPIKVNAIVKNSGSTSVFKKDVELSSGYLKSSAPTKESIAILPPFAQRDVKFSLNSANLLLSAQDTLVLSYNDSQISRPLNIKPFYKLFLSPIFVASISTVLLIVAIGALIFKKYFKKSKPAQLPKA